MKKEGEYIPSKPESFEEIYGKARGIALSMSHRWNEIPRGGFEKRWQTDVPSFAYIDSLSDKEGKPGERRTGVQKYFETRVADAEKEKDENVKRRLMFRLLEEVKGYEKDMNGIIKEYKTE